MAHDDMSSSSLAPVADGQRVFSGFAQASLWFSLGVGLLVMQVGAYLVPAVGTQDALLAIVLGSLLGAGLLAWTAKIGCDSGLSSAGLMYRVYGDGFARLPVVLNIVQLIGWTTFELVVMRDGTRAIFQQLTGVEPAPWWPTLLWGGVLTLLMTGSMLTLVRRFVSRIGLPLVILSLLWLSWHFVGVLQTQGVDAFLARTGDGSMGLLAAIDLVVAMPVSWLPLVADYARHGRSGRGALAGTWIGYAIANVWCYALGLLVASVSAPDADLVTALLLAQGGLLALGLILLDELDNAYGDVYSASVCTQAEVGGWRLRRWGVVIAIACTALALLLPMHSLEPFLLVLSSVFVPLYGVILGRLACGGSAHGTSMTVASGSAAAASGPVAKNASETGRNAGVASAALLWLIGIAVFHATAQFAPQFGSALPSLLVTFVLAWLTRPRHAATVSVSA